MEMALSLAECNAGATMGFNAASGSGFWQVAPGEFDQGAFGRENSGTWDEPKRLYGKTPRRPGLSVTFRSRSFF